jgi:protein gp37
MNSQVKRDKDGKITSLCIEWTHVLGVGTGYTVNPVRGCKHGCEWNIGGGLVECYAKTLRDRMNGVGAFEKITWHPEALAEVRRHKTRAGIFLCSMSDLFGHDVRSAWINEVLATIEACPWHVFFTLTKNPVRLTGFAQLAQLDNLLCGISAPPTKMFGKLLTPEQQAQWLRVGLERLSRCGAKWPWMSIEPLSFDIAPILAEFKGLLKWAVIGAASNGRVYYQPAESDLRNVLAVLDGTPCFFKGNLDRSLAIRCAGRWLEDFPAIGLDIKREIQTTLI